MISPKKALSVVAVSLMVSQGLIACKPNIANNPADSHPTDTRQPDNMTTRSGEISTSTKNSSSNCNNQAIYRAYTQQNPQQKVQVLGCGQIKKILQDDNDGTRHQKFLISIDGYPQMSVLVAHNIDLAARVANIQPNTPIRFYGEYIYNEKGGVLHWTHKDPAARHQDGWLDYNGQKFW